MAANQGRFMCESPCAGEIKIHSRPPTATREKKLFLLVHETLCVGELFQLI
jgi:hypothetical protein